MCPMSWTMAVLLFWILLGFVGGGAPAESWSPIHDINHIALDANVTIESSEAEYPPSEQREFKLDLSRKHIHDLDDLEKLIEFTELDLSNNNISKLDNKIFDQFKYLRKVNLSHNPIKLIQPLSSDTVEELYLNDVHLHYIKQQTFRNMTALTKLSISNNKYFNSLHRDGVFSADTLQVLQASHCGIMTIRLDNLTNLTQVNLSYNNIHNITKISFETNPNLRIVDLSHNKIRKIEENAFENNPNLYSIDLSNNDIIGLSWGLHLNNLRALNVSHNQITQLPELRFEQMRDLDLSDNFIVDLPEDFDEITPNLRVLDLRRNLIRELRKFKSSSIEILDLSECKITTIVNTAFNESQNMRVLNVSDNKIKSIHFVFYLLNLTQFSLENNVWECDCTDEVQMNLVQNVNMASSLLCDSFPWDQFCAMKETEETEETEGTAETEDIEEFEVQSAEMGIQQAGSSEAVGWSIGACMFCILMVAGWFGKKHYDKVKARNEVGQQLRSAEKPLSAPVDLLVSQALPSRYNYVYVDPPLEEVERRRTIEMQFQEASDSNLLSPNPVK